MNEGYTVIESSTLTMENQLSFDEFVEARDALLNVLSIRQSIKNVEAAIDMMGEEDNAQDLLEEWEALHNMLDIINWKLGHMLGQETLTSSRKFWGTEVSKHNVLQEKHYKLQKERYENCKRGKKYFTQEDRSFIDYHKSLNEKHQAEEFIAMEYREFFADMIEAAFPEAPFDLAWDEFWAEPVTA